MTIRRWLAALAVCLFGFAGSADAQKFQADSNISVFSDQVANNTTAVQVCKSACSVYMIDAFNNGTTLAYIKLYNSATATCGSGTPQWRGMIPYGSSSSGGGFGLPNINGDSYSNGAWICVTTGYADSDTGAPAATTYIVNLHYKNIGQSP